MRSIIAAIVQRYPSSSTCGSYFRRTIPNHTTAAAVATAATYRNNTIAAIKYSTYIQTTAITQAKRPNRKVRCYTTIELFTTNTVHEKLTMYPSSLLMGNSIHHPSLTTSIVMNASNGNHQQIRTMGSKKNSESKHQKNKAKQKSMIKKQLLQKQQQKISHQQQQQQAGGGSTVVTMGDEHSLNVVGTSSITPAKVSGAAGQHKEWVEFQKSIVVEGFETGQVLDAIDGSKKGRSGGKAAAKKRLTKRDEMAEKIKERQRLAGGGGGEFPPMRYSDEETERLLKVAYAAIPKRTGKRGTLNLKRQKRRWHLVKEIHRTYKGHIMRFHVRRMERRSKKIKQIVDFLANGAPTAVQQDLEYQTKVRERYMRMIEVAAARAATRPVSTSETPLLQGATTISQSA